MKRAYGFTAAILAGALIFNMTAIPALAEEEEAAAERTSARVYTGLYQEQEYSDDAKRPLAKSVCPQVTLNDIDKEAYPGLAKAFDAINEEKRAAAAETYQSILEEAKSRYEEDPTYEAVYTDEEAFYVLRSDPHIVSLLGVYDGYTGGAHGYSGYRPVNLDTTSGDTLKLTDVVLDADAFQDLVKATVTANYPDVEEDLVNSYFEETAADDMLWTAGYEGITCYFESYTLGAYAIGPQIVLIPFEGNEALFSEDVMDVPENFGMDVPMNQHIRIGGREIQLWGDMEEYGWYKGLNIIVDGETTHFGEDDIYAYEFKAMYLRSNGEEYLYLQSYAENDYAHLTIFHLGDTVEIIGTSPLYEASIYDQNLGFGASTALTDPEDMLLSVSINLLGTMSGTSVFRVGEDGMPEAVEPYFLITADRVLTTKTELDAKEVDEEGNVSGDVQIPAGTKLTIFRTDNVSIVDLREDDGSLIRVEVTGGEFPHIIDGTDVEDLFDGIMYAG